ncbi:MAG TPA: hypothetical protein VE958_13555, partial [Bryobacteraceae bacterium]|nr:hypothetical protein [Bryobacteraceae bacterium]
RRDIGTEFEAGGVRIAGGIMSRLAEAIGLIEREVMVKRARCVIADEGCADESSLLGTRDGLLNLALALLRFVADADAGLSWVESDGCAWDDRSEGRAWDDRLKSALYMLPTHSAWLCGAYLFKDHAAFMAALSQLVDPQIGSPLLNNPAFRDPSGEEEGAADIS